VRAVELSRTFEAAQRRPAAGFDQTAHVADGIARPSIVMPVPARAIWSLPLPRHGLFHAFIAVDAPGQPAAAVRFRLGISDNRTYEELIEHTQTGTQGWTELRADLSAYAGLKWSLFYRPDRITWRLVLATDALNGSPVRAVWGAPEVLTDLASGREYLLRRQQLH
jgi:hypothetical protein